MNNDPYINYTVTKIGDNTYSMTYTLVAPNTIQQQNFIVAEKLDADGTKIIEKTAIAPASVVTNVSYSDASPGTINNGFYSNLDTSNVAIGGTVYEIESTSGYYN